MCWSVNVYKLVLFPMVVIELYAWCIYIPLLCPEALYTVVMVDFDGGMCALDTSMLMYACVYV